MMINVLNGRKLILCNKCGWRWWVGIMSNVCGNCKCNDFKTLEIKK